MNTHFPSVDCTGFKSIWPVLPDTTKNYLLEPGEPAVTFPSEFCSDITSQDTAAAQLSALISYDSTKNNHSSLIT